MSGTVLTFILLTKKSDKKCFFFYIKEGEPEIWLFCLFFILFNVFHDDYYKKEKETSIGWLCTWEIAFFSHSLAIWHKKQEWGNVPKETSWTLWRQFYDFHSNEMKDNKKSHKQKRYVLKCMQHHDNNSLMQMRSTEYTILVFVFASNNKV